MKNAFPNIFYPSLRFRYSLPTRLRRSLRFVNFFRGQAARFRVCRQNISNAAGFRARHTIKDPFDYLSDTAESQLIAQKRGDSYFIRCV